LTALGFNEPRLLWTCPAEIWSSSFFQRVHFLGFASTTSSPVPYVFYLRIFATISHGTSNNTSSSDHHQITVAVAFPPIPLPIQKRLQTSRSKTNLNRDLQLSFRESRHVLRSGGSMIWSLRCGSERWKDAGCGTTSRELPAWGFRWSSCFHLGRTCQQREGGDCERHRQLLPLL
jgi:hypothetical protein